MFRSQSELAIENLALRQQLAVFVAKGQRPRITGADRWFWVTLRRVWSRWTEALIIIRPETVVRWHRAGFRRYWTWLSGRHGDRVGHPPKRAFARPFGASRRRILVGRTTNSRRAAHAGLRGVGEYGVAPHAAPPWAARRRQTLAHLPPQPPRRHCRHGLLRGPDATFRCPLRLVRDSTH